MKLTDGKRTVDIKMQVWDGSGYGPDWSNDFFVAGNLPRIENKHGLVYIVKDVGYCIDQATDWAGKHGDYAAVAPWEENEARVVTADELATELPYRVDVAKVFLKNGEVVQ